MKKINTIFILLMYSSITLFASTNTSGKVFYNYSMNLDEERNNAFNMKRAYLSFANDISFPVVSERTKILLRLSLFFLFSISA